LYRGETPARKRRLAGRRDHAARSAVPGSGRTSGPPISLPWLTATATPPSSPPGC
jgi:hypothetical protein